MMGLDILLPVHVFDCSYIGLSFTSVQTGGFIYLAILSWLYMTGDVVNINTVIISVTPFITIIIANGCNYFVIFLIDQN